MTRRRWALLGVVSPPLAAVLVLMAGVLTPGYDPVDRTISRLAAPGGTTAAAALVATCLVALSCLVVAMSIHGRVSRWALIVAGVALFLTDVFRLDDTSATSTVLHRLASGVAVGGLVVAPLGYGPISVVIGAVEVGLLIVALPLLPTSFDAWGLWERCLLALPLAWMVFVAARVIVSSEAAIKTSRATSSRSG